MFTAIVLANAKLRCASKFVLILTVMLSLWSPESAFATTGNETSHSKEGISVAIVPPEVQAGDIVELRVEMNRETWGRFEFGLPDHPQLGLVAQEKIPVSYNDRRYQQRHSILLQPVSSGEIAIGGVTVVVSTSDGEKTIELPELTLRVKAFGDVELSDAPLPLPSAERRTPTNSLPWWFSFLICAAFVLSLALFSFFRNREAASSPVRLGQELSKTSHLVDQLRAGRMPKRDLEVLLNDPNASISAELRSKIEEAVYSVQTDPSDLVILLQKELPA